eukprot:s3723_g4.t2
MDGCLGQTLGQGILGGSMTTRHMVEMGVSLARDKLDVVKARSAEEDGDDFGASDLTRILSKFFRQAAPMLRQCRTTLLCTNQFRGGSMLFGPKEVPFGGQALGRWSSIRLCTSEPQIQEIAGCTPSLQCQVDIVKFAVPEQTQKANSVEFRLVFGKGASWGGSVSHLRSNEHDVQELSA